MKTATSPLPAYTDHPVMPDDSSNVVPPKRLAIVLPAQERGRGPDDLKRLDRLNARLAKPVQKGDERAAKAREQILKEREGLEAVPAAKAEADWLIAAARETIALAESRGEAAERLSSGAVRVNTRDALYSLVRKLTADQYDAGVEARACYEARCSDVGSQMGSESSGGAHNNDRYVFLRLQRAKKLQRIATIERAIAVDDACRKEPASLQMFRAVCGDNKALSVWGEGRAFERSLSALKLALDVAHDVIRGK